MVVGVCYARPTDEMIIVFPTPTETVHVMGPLVKSQSLSFIKTKFDEISQN